MKIYLVRHPQPLVASGICYGASDLACSAQALERAAFGLLEELPQRLPMISSTLSRCERLAQILCRLEPTFAYKTDQKLAEMHFGAWEMQPWAQIPSHELSQWTDAFASYRCGGSGESCAQFVQRVAKRWHQSAQAGEDQIWITHAGVIRAVQWLSGQPHALFAALTAEPARCSDLAALLRPLRAADWPSGEVAFAQVQTWDWPLAWPQQASGQALPK